MVWSIQKTVLILLAAAVVAFAAWMLWPRSLGAAVEPRGGLSALVITSGVMDAQLYQDLEEYAVEEDSPEAAALREILEGYAYHLCWESLTREQEISDIGSVTVQLNDSQGNVLTVHSGTGKLFLRGQVVRTGYLGSAQAAALCGELTALLQDA